MAVLQHRADFARETERPFSPRTFINWFTACGGGYSLTPGGQLWLGVIQTGAEEPDRRMAMQLMRVLTPEQIESVRDYLLSREGFSPQRAAWEDAKARLDDAVRDFDALEAALPGCDELDAICDVMTSTQDELFDAPAPTMQAVLWKLDHLQEVAEGAFVTPKQLAQVSTDIRRLFGEA